MYLIMGLVLVIITFQSSILFFCVIMSLFFYVDFIDDVMVSSLIPISILIRLPININSKKIY